MIRGGGCRGRWFANLTQQLIIIALPGERLPLSIQQYNVFRHNLFQLDYHRLVSNGILQHFQIDYHTIFRLITTQSSD